MHITLIGMSNIGKTHWSQALAKLGYERIDCDLEIEKELGPILQKLGYAGIHDVAKWMGQPYAPHYAETSRQFMEYECEVMQRIIERLRNAAPGKKFVIDTTGSVIYAGKEIAEQLRALTQVVYLEASSAHRRELFEKYITNPKPVVWGDGAFAPLPGEENSDTLKRCYPNLLESRARRYKNMAEVVLPFPRHKYSHVDAKQLFSLA